uniref:Sugar phosphate exchanger 3 n=1 Tax=Romanomermis culicivorax TaxID=13658 RepID=A0A915HI50_ROMCU
MSSSFVRGFGIPEHEESGEDFRDEVPLTKSKKSPWTYHHVVIFFVTFSSYCLMHAIRKTFSNVKYSLVSTWTSQNLSDFVYRNETWNNHHLFESDKEAEHFLGLLDALFMFSYATGLYVSGAMGDRIDPRLVLSCGIWGTAIVNFVFGYAIETYKFYSISLYILLWIMNGLLQSCAWPAEVCIMGNWFGRGSRGLILGIWSACASVGNIVGSYLAAAVLPYGYEARKNYAFLVNSTLLFSFGFVVFFGIVSAPRELGMPDTVEHDHHNADASQHLLPKQPPNSRPFAISFCQAILLPGVIAYSLAYAFLKLVNYSIFFWLPYYMTNALGWKEIVADQVSTWYDWGGIIGGIIGGVISDALGRRTPVVVLQLSLFLISLFVYTKSPNDTIINGFLMGVAGFFGNGAANLISAACSADLGRQEGLHGNAEALSTVTGIVDGTGSVGAALGQVVIPSLYQLISWNAVFYMFMLMIILTILCLSKLCYRETKEIYQNYKVTPYSRLPTDETIESEPNASEERSSFD